MKTTIELLREARAYLARRVNWCAGHRWHPSGANCALGALERANGDAADSWILHPDIDHWLSVFGPVTRRLAYAAVFLDGPTHPERRQMLPFYAGACIASFNDSEGWERVVKMFDLAIKLEQDEIDRQAKELVESSEIGLVLTAK